MAEKKKLDVNDFPVAPRRSRPSGSNTNVTPLTTPADTSAEELPKKGEGAPAGAEQAAEGRKTLPRLNEQERRDAVEERVLRQQESHRRLKDLKRSRQREAKHYVNVPLDYETKKRLESAAHENDLKMTVIMKAAIDQYLKDNGY